MGITITKRFPDHDVGLDEKGRSTAVELMIAAGRTIAAGGTGPATYPFDRLAPMISGGLSCYGEHQVRNIAIVQRQIDKILAVRIPRAVATAILDRISHRPEPVYDHLPGAIGERSDTSIGAKRTEVQRRPPRARLQRRPPKPTGRRSCMNGVTMAFHSV